MLKSTGKYPMQEDATSQNALGLPKSTSQRNEHIPGVLVNLQLQTAPKAGRAVTTNLVTGTKEGIKKKLLPLLRNGFRYFSCRFLLSLRANYSRAIFLNQKNQQNCI